MYIEYYTSLCLHVRFNVSTNITSINIITCLVDKNVLDYDIKLKSNKYFGP